MASWLKQDNQYGQQHQAQFRNSQTLMPIDFVLLTIGKKIYSYITEPIVNWSLHTVLLLGRGALLCGLQEILRIIFCSFLGRKGIIYFIFQSSFVVTDLNFCSVFHVTHFKSHHQFLPLKCSLALLQEQLYQPFLLFPTVKLKAIRHRIHGTRLNISRKPQSMS